MAEESAGVYTTDDIEWLDLRDDWKGLKSIVMVKSFRTVDGTTSKEMRYYIVAPE